MINVDSQDKIRIAKSGANKLFKEDYDIRRQMSDQQLLDLFDRVWSQKLRDMIEMAEVISSEEVTRRLLDKYHDFVDPEQEHRSFHYLKAEFIAQLQLFETKKPKLTQLWRVASSDIHPKTLFITFSSVEERERFTQLSKSLGTNDEKLGFRLIHNFMELHPDFMNENGGEEELWDDDF